MDLVSAVEEHGWALAHTVAPGQLVERLRDALDRACSEQRTIQVRNGVDGFAAGTAHHLPCVDGVFLELLEFLASVVPFGRYFEGPYILNTYGGVLNLPGDPSYVSRVHRDQRTHTGAFRLMAQALVMIDAFTEENGATYFLTGSHRMRDKPSDDDFFDAATRATGPAGSIVVFDSKLWHAAGVNRSVGLRRALTLAFARPFIKQQLDYPRALGYERRDSLTPTLRQVLGYNARVPATLDEWYQPPDRRLYQRDQG